MADIGLHTEIFTPLSIILLGLGAVLGYGGGKVVSLFNKNPSEKTVLIVRFIGVLLVAAGMIVIFIR